MTSPAAYVFAVVATLSQKNLNGRYISLLCQTRGRSPARLTMRTVEYLYARKRITEPKLSNL